MMKPRKPNFCLRSGLDMMSHLVDCVLQVSNHKYMESQQNMSKFKVYCTLMQSTRSDITSNLENEQSFQEAYFMCNHEVTGVPGENIQCLA